MEGADTAGDISVSGDGADNGRGRGLERKHRVGVRNFFRQGSDDDRAWLRHQRGRRIGQLRAAIIGHGNDGGRRGGHKPAGVEENVFNRAGEIQA